MSEDKSHTRGAEEEIIFDAMKRVIEIEEYHLGEAADQYKGQYISYRYAHLSDYITTMWLEIPPFDDKAKLARYTSFQRSSDGIPIRGAGLVIPTKRNIQMIGWRLNTSVVEMAILGAYEYEFKFLHGIALTTTSRGDVLVRGWMTMLRK